MNSREREEDLKKSKDKQRKKVVVAAGTTLGGSIVGAASPAADTIYNSHINRKINAEYDEKVRKLDRDYNNFKKIAKKKIRETNDPSTREKMRKAVNQVENNYLNEGMKLVSERTSKLINNIYNTSASNKAVIGGGVLVATGIGSMIALGNSRENKKIQKKIEIDRKLRKKEKQFSEDSKNEKIGAGIASGMSAIIGATGSGVVANELLDKKDDSVRSRIKDVEKVALKKRREPI